MDAFHSSPSLLPAHISQKENFNFFFIMCIDYSFFSNHILKRLFVNKLSKKCNSQSFMNSELCVELITNIILVSMVEALAGIGRV
jgi:hypothetical protein